MNELYLSIFSHSFQHFIRIERVAEAVADVVDRDDGDEDHQAREDRQPGIFDEVILRGGDEVAPCGFPTCESFRKFRNYETSGNFCKRRIIARFARGDKVFLCEFSE
jgi:hypothetical protein